ncbi:MAG: baseplate J/gp47 family protein [Deltaproteobacteria bacterium]|nr:baseplate J/gp47 family protein [Deltaproteobacteria bacterium]
MPLTRPSIGDLKTRIRSDIKSALGVSTVLRRSLVDVLSQALAGVAHTQLGYIDFVGKQLFLDQAEEEFLERWGSIYRVERKGATFTQLSLQFFGENGSTIPNGTELQRSDGVLYTTDAEGTIGATEEVIISATAQEPGAHTNLEDGESLSLISPMVGVQSQALVDSTLISGEDEENDESYRERILDQIRKPPNGGDADDYIQWARAISGVTRAWVFPGHLGLGTVGVTFVQDGEEDIFPEEAKVQEVSDYIETVRPVTASIFVFSPGKAVLDLTLKLKPNTESVREAVQAEIEDFLLREAAPGGAYQGPKEVHTGTILLSQLDEAISVAEGEEDHQIVNLTSDFVVPTGYLAVLGTITWEDL